MYADLHLHSIYSDGTDTPNELLELAKGHAISVISITDHDSVDAYDFLDINQAQGLRVITGTEISTVRGHAYLHILGYYIDANSKELRSYIHRASTEKTENTRVNFENAMHHGAFNYDWERVLQHNVSQERISGVHVVYALEKDEVTVNDMRLWDMFHKYFRAESPDFIPTETLTAYDAVNVIKAAGGIPVIAHPKSVGDDETVIDLIRYGVMGIEVYHPIHDEADQLKYKEIAENAQVWITGGTDWHGGNNGKNVTRFGMQGLSSDKYPILSLG